VSSTSDTDRNFIGIDIKGARMWRGAKTATEEKMPNVAFVRTRIQLIEHFFGPGEVDGIWITFPDPQPQKPRIRKRLTSPEFLQRYRNISGGNCIVHLKTDNTVFFDYTLEVIRNENLPLLFHSYDIDNDHECDEVRSIRTFYEMMFREQGEKIKYLKFGLFAGADK